MADAMVDRTPIPRFFCHRCNVEFEDVLQDYTCPYCESGFIEQLENETGAQPMSGDDFSDADTSNIEDVSNVEDMSNIDQDESDEGRIPRSAPPVLNDLAFLMSGGRIRPMGHHTLLEQLVVMITGGARTVSGTVTAGAPLVFVGAPGDYVFGGEGLDAVVTQLLGQLENSGPPPLPSEQLAALPTVSVTQEQVSASLACSVCWENFILDETVSRLECEHIFHPDCIKPWLQLHATCPICRRSLLPEPPLVPLHPTTTATTNTTTTTTSRRRPAPAASDYPPVPPLRPFLNNTLSHFVIRRSPRRPRGVVGSQTRTYTVPDSSSTSSSTSVASSVAPGAGWPPRSTTSSNSTSSLNSSDTQCQQYNMDIDYD